MKVIDRMTKYNYPHTIMNWTNIEAAERGEIKVVLADDVMPLKFLAVSGNDVVDVNDVSVRLGHFHNGVMVSDDYAENGGLSDDYLDAPIQGRYVYAPLNGSGAYLYTGVLPYIVSDAPLSPEDNANPYEAPYKRVFFESEATIADLYKNACRYSYYRDVDSFQPLPEAGVLRNCLELVRESITIREVGTVFGRLENLMILVHFLLSKVSLSDAERSYLAPLLSRAADGASVAVAAHEQAAVMDIIAASACSREALRAYTEYPSAILK